MAKDKESPRRHPRQRAMTDLNRRGEEMADNLALAMLGVFLFVVAVFAAGFASGYWWSAP